MRNFIKMIEPFLAVCLQPLLGTGIRMSFGISRSTIASRMSEYQDFREGIGTQPISAMDRDTAAFTGHINARHTRFSRMEIGHLEAAHGIMAGGTDEYRFLRDVDAGKTACKIINLPQALMDACRRDLREIEVYTGMDTFADTAPLLDLRRNPPGNDIARCQLHAFRCILLHEALPVLVDQQGTFCTTGF